jgi:hypothetical protein
MLHSVVVVTLREGSTVAAAVIHAQTTVCPGKGTRLKVWREVRN